MGTNRLEILGTLFFLTFAMASDSKPTLSESPMSADQIAVYQTFLASYTSGGKSSHFNLSNRTYALSEDDRANCANMQLDSEADSRSVIHQFGQDTFLSPNITLVDPEKQKRAVIQNDPSNTMQQGKPVGDAVAGAFAAGLLSLSEVVFDKDHQQAVMSFSFVCGGLCGHGGAIVFEKKDGKWKRSKRCGSWIS
jgi:hypothetical protein